MRDLVRNNPMAAQAVQVLVNNIVGTGIRPRAATGDAGLNARVDALWKRWAAGCDQHGHTDFHGVLGLAVREMIEGGDVFAIRRTVKAIGPRAKEATVSTFHALSLQICRAHAERAGYPKDFAVWQGRQQRRLLARTLDELRARRHVVHLRRDRERLVLRRQQRRRLAPRRRADVGAGGGRRGEARGEGGGGGGGGGEDGVVAGEVDDEGVLREQRGALRVLQRKENYRTYEDQGDFESCKELVLCELEKLQKKEFVKKLNAREKYVRVRVRVSSWVPKGPRPRKG